MLLLVVVFAWFGSGVEDWKLGHRDELEKQPLRAVWPPWRPLRLYVSFGGDERLYFQYAQLVVGGAADLDYVAGKQQGERAENLRRLTAAVRPGPGARMPYRDFPVEYPPVAVAWMALSRLFAGTLAGYRLAFTATSALLYLILVAVAARLGALSGNVTVEQVWWRMGVSALAVGPLLVQRFDLLPATLTAGALLAVCRRREVIGGVLLGLAIMAKLYPALVVLPIAAFLIAGGAGRRVATVAAAAAATVLVIAAPFVMAAPGAFARSVLLYGARPVQIESLAGAVGLALRGGGAVFGAFGSYNVQVPLGVGTLVVALQMIGVVALTAAAVRAGARWSGSDAAGTRALLALALVAVVLVICTSKVLSPQYLIWLLPFSACSSDRRVMSWAVASALLTQGFHPFLYSALRSGHPAVVAVLLARNAALVALAVCAIADLFARFVTSARPALRGDERLSS